MTRTSIQMLLTDVAVSHALTANHVTRGKTVTVLMQTRKDRKYAGIAARLGAELLNVSVDACGGMAGDAFELVRAVGEEGARWSAGAWHSGAIERQMLAGIAMAVQRGNALTMLCGYTRATAADARCDSSYVCCYVLSSLNWCAEQIGAKSFSSERFPG